MRFALLGNHPDGIEMALALASSVRHTFAACTALLPEAVFFRLGSPRRVSDLEEVLADPDVEAVLVAGSPATLPDQLRRSLQSERHVLCVHPAGDGPELAYEAAMIRDDTRRLLLPLLPAATHPALRRLAGLVRRGKARPEAPFGDLLILEMEILSEGEVLLGVEWEGEKPALPVWDVLRAVGGDVDEVSGYAPGEEIAAGQPALLSGRFVDGGVFQVTLLPNRPESSERLTLTGRRGRAELLFPVGRRGPAFLTWREPGGELREEEWEPWDPWLALVEEFEVALGLREPSASPVPHDPSDAIQKGAAPAAITAQVTLPALPMARLGPLGLSWQDEVRALELDDAARRSVAKRRSSVLEYQVASEEVGFKGTMTLVGCGLLLASLFLLILSRWVPALGWVIFPVLLLFLAMQSLRYLARNKPDR
jgi:hypothetical protein